MNKMHKLNSGKLAVCARRCSNI